jgi:hypothetical protein
MFHIDAEKTFFLKKLLKTIAQSDMDEQFADDMGYELDEFQRIADETYEVLG